VVLGAAGTSLFMAESVERTPGFRCAGFLDDDPRKIAEGYGGLPVLGSLRDWLRLPEDHLFLTYLYSSKKTPRFFGLIRSLAIPVERWAVVIDPRASVSPRASLGAGTFVGPNCVVEPLAALGRWCALLGNAYVAHHTILGDYVVCANNVSLAGGIRVGDAAYFGANCVVREYTVIGAAAVVGAGSVVIRDVSDGEIVVGNPARVLARDFARHNSPDAE